VQAGHFLKIQIQNFAIQGEEAKEPYKAKYILFCSILRRRSLMIQSVFGFSKRAQRHSASRFRFLGRFRYEYRKWGGETENHGNLELCFLIEIPEEAESYWVRDIFSKQRTTGTCIILICF
jgi:hypothetical protein